MPASCLGGEIVRGCLQVQCVCFQAKGAVGVGGLSTLVSVGRCQCGFEFSFETSSRCVALFRSTCSLVIRRSQKGPGSIPGFFWYYICLQQMPCGTTCIGYVTRTDDAAFAYVEDPRPVAACWACCNTCLVFSQTATCEHVDTARRLRLKISAACGQWQSIVFWIRTMMTRHLRRCLHELPATQSSITVRSTGGQCKNIPHHAWAGRLALSI